MSHPQCREEPLQSPCICNRRGRGAAGQRDQCELRQSPPLHARNQATPCSLFSAYVPRSAEWSRSRCPPAVKLQLRLPSHRCLGTSSAPPYRRAYRECTLRWDDESGIASVGSVCPPRSEGFRFLGRRGSSLGSCIRC